MPQFAIEVSKVNKNFYKERSLKEVILNPLNGRSFKYIMHRPLSKIESPIIALKNVSFKIPKGELWCLIGSNGSGKTTLIKILTTLIISDSGKAHVNNYDVKKEEQQVRNSIGLIYNEERSFFWRLTGRQNLEFFAALYGLKRKDIRKRIDYVLDIVGLKDKADIRFDSYSTGMKRKMSIARGLLNEPDIILADEPTNGLDPVAAKHIIDFLRNELVKKRGKTILMASHNLNEVQSICDGIILLHKGKVKASGPLKSGSKLLEIFEKMTGD